MTKTSKTKLASTKKKVATKKSVAKKATTSKKVVAKKRVAKKSVAVKAKTTEVKVASKVATKKASAAKSKAASIKATKPKTKPKTEYIHPVTGVKTTGHAWDGIEEFNNPLPRWWLWSFFACIFFAVCYALYYPTIPMPGGHYKGMGEWSSIKQMHHDIKESEHSKRSFNEQITTMSAAEIEADAELSEFAIAGGKALFALHCSQCHGSSAQGGKGYPSFLDDEWLWGSKIEDIVYTITNGVRHYDNENTRSNTMMAYGEEEVLSSREIKDVARYIKVISEDFTENESSDRGAEIFAENCISCHGENGQGIHEMGAPALNNAVWLYGGRISDIIETVTGGRGGHMPAWNEKLTPDSIKKLAVFVRSLSGVSN